MSKSVRKYDDFKRIFQSRVNRRYFIWLLNRMSVRSLFSSSPSQVSMQQVTSPRLPRNAEGMKLAEEIRQSNKEREQEAKNIKRKTRERYIQAVKATRLKREEQKIAKELKSIHTLEHQMQLDSVSTIRRTNMNSRAYMVESKYAAKQRRLNEMLIDDRQRPRYSQPKPMELPAGLLSEIDV